MLVIEVDGGQHALQKAEDHERDTWLVNQGFQVLRFWNNEVIGNIDGVVETIYRKLPTPSPKPLPPGEGSRCTGE